MDQPSPRSASSMLSAVIATHESERQLVPTLAALVPGATAGLLREVIIADAGSRDDTAAIAEVAGCRLLVVAGTAGARLAAAAKTARAPWLMFVRPGIVLDPNWVETAGEFIRVPSRDGDERAATFRRNSSGAPFFTEAVALIATALGRVRPEQSVIVSKRAYDLLGGHRDRADAEADLLRRIGRRRIVTLPAAAAILST
jgi:glycosyltransferase involved in cell wall biosynthesis